MENGNTRKSGDSFINQYGDNNFLTCFNTFLAEAVLREEFESDYKPLADYSSFEDDFVSEGEFTTEETDDLKEFVTYSSLFMTWNN